jgi:hypothetical protein
MSSPRKLTGWILLSFLILSVFAALVRAAVIGSSDFQWWPTVLFVDGVDPYSYFLDGNIGRLIAKSQIPNYLPLTYVLLAPLAFLREGPAYAVWAIVNIIFCASSCFLLVRSFKLPSKLGLLCFVLLSFSAPFASSIKQGQQSSLVLFCFALGLWIMQCQPPTAFKWIAAGVVYGAGFVKYSFAPSFAAPLLFKPPLLLVSAIGVQLAGGFLFAWRTGSTLAGSIVFPMQIAKASVSNSMIGQGDMMSLFSMLHANHTDANPLPIALLALLLSVVIPIFAIRRAMNEISCWAFISIASLSFLRHLYYDYIFLLFPLLMVLSGRPRRGPARVIVSLTIFWFWYLAQPLRIVLDAMQVGDSAHVILICLGFLLNLLAMASIYYSSPKNEFIQ